MWILLKIMIFSQACPMNRVRNCDPNSDDSLGSEMGVCRCPQKLTYAENVRLPKIFIYLATITSLCK